MKTKQRIDGLRGMKFYFAYGMNTNLREMRDRCPAAVPQGTLILEDHRLVFRGVADIVEARAGSARRPLADQRAVREGA